MTIRVLLVDDQEVVRLGLRLVVDRRPDLTVVGEAADGQAGVAAAYAHRPDVIVMDVRMPGMTGVEATGRILSEWPHPDRPPRILVLTTFDLDEYVYAALRNGAAGFLLKNTAPEQFTEAIRVVAAGEAMLAPSTTRRLVQAFSRLPPALFDHQGYAPAEGVPELPSGWDSLTERELAVLVLVGQGRSNAEIAAELGLTESNVKSRVNRILYRLGLANRVQAALLVHRSGLAGSG